jgi:cation:H+ antiporter
MTVMSVVLVVVGLVALVAGAEVLVRGARHLAVNLGVSPLVVGLTVVAFGTSAPEMAVGVQAAIDGETSLAMGNVVGSNMFNVLAVLGISALFGALVVHQKLISGEVRILVFVTGVIFGVSLVAGVISRWFGLVLLIAVIAYTVWAIWRERDEPDDVVAEYAGEFGEDGEERPHWALNVTFVVAGLAGLVVGSRWLVSGASDIAVGVGMSELLVGVTIVAVGTSLPELATSVVAAVRGERDIAVGNVMGSSLFNLLVVLGLTALVSPVGVPVGSEVTSFQLPALLFVSLLCVGVLWTGYAIQRWEGVVFVVLYVVYLATTVVDSQFPDAVGAARAVAVAIGVAVAIVVVVNTVRVRRRGNEPILEPVRD